MDQERMDRTQFFQKAGALREPELQKVLWDLYWRGKGELKRRIEDLLEPAKATPASKRLPELDGASILHEVLRFSGLIVSGAYMGGTREVSRQERSKWRVTFRRHVENAAHLLKQGDLEHGPPALESLIDVLCQMHDYDYVHSEDPVQAAGIVVSDRVELLWRTVLEVQGFQVFTRTAARQLLQWERAYGWTRYGAAVAEKERSLATVLAGMLHGADSWTHFADAYLAALDELLKARQLAASRPKSGSPWEREWPRQCEGRAKNLAAWHDELLTWLRDGESEDRLERIAQHPALAGPETEFFQAKLCWGQGQAGRTHELMAKCLKRYPGAPAFIAFAKEIGMSGAS